MRFLITGCPRSGTTYISNLLTMAGIDCGHEKALLDMGPKGALRIRFSRHGGESSWVGAAFLQHFHMPKVHLVRAPMDVIESQIGMGWLMGKDRKHEEGVRRWAPDVFEEPTGPRRLARFWLDWNALADEDEDTERWHIADLDRDRIGRLGARSGYRLHSDDIETAFANTHDRGSVSYNKPEPLKISDIGKYLYAELEERAEQYGIPMRY